MAPARHRTGPRPSRRSQSRRAVTSTPPGAMTRWISATARRQPGIRWSTWTSIAPAHERSWNGRWIASARSTAGAGRHSAAALARYWSSIGAERSMPTTGLPDGARAARSVRFRPRSPGVANACPSPGRFGPRPARQRPAAARGSGRSTRRPGRTRPSRRGRVTSGRSSRTSQLLVIHPAHHGADSHRRSVRLWLRGRRPVAWPRHGTTRRLPQGPQRRRA